MAVARRVSPRLLAYNERVRAIAARHGARVIDIERGGATDARLFHPDRLHANDLGHERIALAAAEALGLPGRRDGAWRDPLPPAPAASRRQALRADARWARAHLAPWVEPPAARRLLGGRRATPSGPSSRRSTRRRMRRCDDALRAGS